MDFKKYFCCNDDIISVLFQLVMLRFETTCGSENGCGKSHFCSEIWSEFGEPCGTPPPPQQQFPGVPTCGVIRWTVPGSRVVENQVDRVSRRKIK